MSVYDYLTNDFQRHLFDVLATNEGHGPNNDTIAYSLSFANDGKPDNKSGYSFGWIQWDLHKQGDKSKAYSIIEDAINNIPEATWNKIVQDNGLDPTYSTTKLLKILVDKTGSSDPTANLFIKSINDQLKNLSATIDTQTAAGVQKIEQHITSLLNGTNGYIRPTQEVIDFINNSELAKLLLADYDNQYGISPGGKMNKFLAGEKVNPGGGDVQIQGPFGYDDLLNYLFDTKYVTNGGAKDILRRISNIVKLESMNGLSAEDQQLLNNLMALRSLKISASELLKKIHALFTTATTTRSPIVLDLDNDGIETTPVGDGTYFDHDANGFRELTVSYRPVYDTKDLRK